MGSTFNRRLVFFFTLTFACFLIFQIIFCLGNLRTTVDPEVFLSRTGLALFGFFFCILGGWYSFGLSGALGFSAASLIAVIFVSSFTNVQIYIWFLLEYAFVGLILFRDDQFFLHRVTASVAEREKYQIEKNELAASYKSKGEAISMLFEKYSTYYNMRKLAEELGTSLSVMDISQIVVNRCIDFVLRGDIAQIALFDSTQKLPVVAFREYGLIQEKKKISRLAESDAYDQWVIKNRKQLIIMDTQQDFRFDANEAQQRNDVRSLIVAPLFQNERTIGTLRIHSSRPHTFVADDLRLLDTVAVLASSALSNAILYEQTEELAIRDSLTGLYVRRHFFDRFKEEHRRALMTKRSLSILMCDLDHFKDCNDRYGHAIGDMILIQFAKILSDISESAIVSRYGGEEFTVLLPETSKAEAVALAERIRKATETEAVVIRRERIPMTVSIGVANLPDDSLDPESLISKADQALYEAKRRGRNQVC